MKHTKAELKALKIQVGHLMLKEGLNAAQISRKTGVSTNTLVKWTKEINDAHVQEMHLQALKNSVEMLTLKVKIKAAKEKFLTEVDAAIDDYLKLKPQL